MKRDEMVMRKWRAKRVLGRGFTLVELMIAMALVGVLTAMIYGMFARTSDALSDVESLSRTLDQARFALDHVRNDIQMAGNQITPNSTGQIDPWVQPPAPNKVIQPFRVFTGWNAAGSRAVYDANDELKKIGEANPESAFHSIIVMGAVDYPLGFSIDNINLSGATTMTARIPGTERGLGRLNRIDPFDVRIAENLNPLGEVALSHTDDRSRMASRIMRIMDGQGFMQFAMVESLDPGPPVQISLSSVSVRGDDQIAGLERFAEDDVSYDVALVDAFLYRVRPSELETRNVQLVRSRLDAGRLMALSTGVLNRAQVEDLIEETVVIADHVVDFRIWFDCVEETGVFADTFWPTEWDYQHEGQDPTCLQPSAASSEIHRARVAHIRLSLRTERENPNRPHLELGGGIAAGFDESGQMVTYDVVPEAPGSASVVTVQASVELTNLAMRGLR